MRNFTRFTPVVAFAAADMATGGPAEMPVAEIVTYRLKDSVSVKEAVEAAKGTQAFLRDTGAVISRSLSRDDDGVWTDHILWTSLEAAKATEAQAMTRPEFATFFAMMQDATAELRHAQVLMQMD